MEQNYLANLISLSFYLSLLEKTEEWLLLTNTHTELVIDVTITIPLFSVYNFGFNKIILKVRDDHVTKT